MYTALYHTDDNISPSDGCEAWRSAYQSVCLSSVHLHITKSVQISQKFSFLVAVAQSFSDDSTIICCVFPFLWASSYVFTSFVVCSRKLESCHYSIKMSRCKRASGMRILMKYCLQSKQARC